MRYVKSWRWLIAREQVRWWLASAGLVFVIHGCGGTDDTSTLIDDDSDLETRPHDVYVSVAEIANGQFEWTDLPDLGRLSEINVMVEEEPIDIQTDGSTTLLKYANEDTLQLTSSSTGFVASGAYEQQGEVIYRF